MTKAANMKILGKVSQNFGNYINQYRGGNVIPGWDHISTKTTQNVVCRTTVPMYRQLLRNHLKIDHGERNH